MNMSFTDWMAKVDAILLLRYGCTSEDLPDYTWRDRWGDGDTPAQAVKSFREDGFDG